MLRLSGAGDEKVMDCKGARRLIPSRDLLANLKGKWERVYVPYFALNQPFGHLEEFYMIEHFLRS